MIEHHPLWWLSFADPNLPKGEQLLGVAIVRGVDILDVASKATLLGCNPGGEVQGLEIPEEAEALFPASHVQRLLTREEAEKLDEIITPGLEKLSRNIHDDLARLRFVIEPDGNTYRIRAASEEK